MRIVSDAFIAAVAAGYEVVFQADVLLGGTVIAEGVPISDGQVTLDRRRLIRGNVQNLLVPGVEWVPVLATDPLAPVGQELAIRAGIAHRDGLGDELVDLGVYRVDVADSQSSPDQGVTTVVTGGDRSSAISDAGFTAPWAIASGTNYATAIAALILDVLPWATLSFTPTSYTTPPLVWAESDNRWQRCVELARDIGMELFVDGAGIFVLRPEPALTDDPVATIRDGEGGTLITAARSWSRVGRPNAVIATSSNSGNETPFRGEAYDLDPESPTAWGGNYGEVVEHITGTYASDAQALDAAVARLRSQIGIVQGLTCDAVPNFALEPSDVVEAERSTLTVDETDVLDALTFQLSAAGRMNAIMRARQVLVTA